MLAVLYFAIDGNVFKMWYDNALLVGMYCVIAYWHVQNHFKVAIVPFWTVYDCNIEEKIWLYERRRGRVVRVLGCGAEGRRFELRPKDWKTLSVHPAANGYLINFKKVKGGERRGLGPAFHMPCPRHDGALTPHCLDVYFAKGTYTFYVLPNLTCFASDLH